MEKEIISLDDLITSSNSYPERAKSSELTEELKENGASLLEKVNALLNDLGIEDVKVSSGFRPSGVNASIANAAKASLHQRCRAIDILDDKEQSLAKAIQKDAEENKENSLLKKHGLWLEHPDSTKGKFTNWCHLDDSNTRKDRPVRVFKP